MNDGEQENVVSPPGAGPHGSRHGGAGEGRESRGATQARHAAQAESLPDGRFVLAFSLEQGSVYVDDVTTKSAREAAAFHAPVLRNFKSQANVMLRDGQSVEYIAAADPISGEVLKIDVTLHVVK